MRLESNLVSLLNNLSPINSITSYLSTTPEQEFAKVSDKFSTLEANAQKQETEKEICEAAYPWLSGYPGYRGKGRAIEITNDAWG